MLWDLPEVIVRLPISRISVVVVAALDAASAFWWWFLPRILLCPLPIVGNAGVCIVVRRDRAGTLGLDILGLRAIILASGLWLIREHGNIVPRRGMPIRIIVPLLRTFQAVALLPTATAVAVRILPRRGRSTIFLYLPVGSVEALVALARNASLVEVQGFVVSSRSLCGPLLGGIVVIATGSVLACAIAKIAILVFIHILQDYLALQVRVASATAVLVMPFDIQLGVLIELHGPFCSTLLSHIVVVVPVLAGGLAVISDLISRSGVVLRVEETIGVLHVVALLVQLVVGATRVVQVHVGLDRAYPQQQHPGRSSRHGGSHWKSTEENRTPQSPKQDAEESLTRH